jgi:flagellar hook-associated protein 3 FlgL
MVNLTNQMLYRVDNLNDQSRKISTQMATGRKLTVGSDDTQTYSRELFIEDKIRKYEGIEVQLRDVQAQNAVVDDTMIEIKTQVENIHLEMMKALNSGATPVEKKIIATNIKSARETLFDLVNTQINGEYLFGGTDATVPPLKKDPNYDVNGKIYYKGDGYLRDVAIEARTYRKRNETGNNIMMYNTSTAVKGETLSFHENERIFDTEGHEWGLKKVQKGDKLLFTIDEGNSGDIKDSDDDVWKLNDGKTKLINQSDDTKTLDVIHLRDNLYQTAPVSTDTLAVDTDDGNGKDVIRKFNKNGEVAKDNDNNVIEIKVNNDGNEPVKYTTDALTTDGLKLMAKHNIFDDINTVIKALELYKDTDTNLDDDVSNYVAISNDESSDIVRDNLDKLVEAFDAANIAHGAIGERNKAFIDADKRIKSKLTHYNILLQDTGAADMAKLAMDTKALEMTYTALYSTISKMNNLSLVNFLK